MSRFYSPPSQIKQARAMRHLDTDVERSLWNKLRAQQLGCKFRRQHPIGSYIVDFACDESKLIIELDGGQHNEPEYAKRDAERTANLQRSGWQILRFWNSDVVENLEGVLQTIASALTRNR